ncbi:SMC-Scp complex subunit ScpB [Methylomarinum sp. Ch1-1]|uniref:SMC-Scp complex subunit ScpB n=1 Tax=Methylomarinum roseum TaxID=3067653 RepID=A0AAU7NRF5_9GAMM|nr:SMC-Scp complex subunit ScpB [Methylomarinum sp. Ch1-1]MDP4520449.1 SMC-Scp complex subunit ScpB [Methylomarinum sp. Ch1-1]
MSVAQPQERQPAKQAVTEESPPEPKKLPAEFKPNEFDVNTKRIVEAILFAANRAMSAKQIQQVFPELEQPEIKEIQAAIDAIIEDYRLRPIGLQKLASGYRFQVKEGMSPWITRLFEEKPPKYSRALLETLAIIAYRQPVTRGEIEEIRGVSVSTQIIRTLLDREWIRVIAHKEVPGRPALYGATKQFLDYFNLSSFDELPTMEEIKDLDLNAETIAPTEQNHREKQETSVQAESSEPESEAVESSTAGETTGAALENSTIH